MELEELLEASIRARKSEPLAAIHRIHGGFNRVTSDKLAEGVELNATGRSSAPGFNRATPDKGAEGGPDLSAEVRPARASIGPRPIKARKGGARGLVRHA